MDFAPPADVERASRTVNAAFAGEQALTIGCRIELGLCLVTTALRMMDNQGASEVLRLLIGRLLRIALADPILSDHAIDIGLANAAADGLMREMDVMDGKSLH